MTCVGTGKISEQTGLYQALQLVCERPVAEGIIRILSKEASGRIGVRGGRFIIGAHITSSGLSGYPALKSFLALKRGMFYYLEGADAGGLTDLEQSLAVDVATLLHNSATADELLRCFVAIAQERGWDCVTEVMVNPHVTKSGQTAFGDTFLDRIAWTATNTFQRLQSLAARQQAAVHEQDSSPVPIMAPAVQMRNDQVQLAADRLARTGSAPPAENLVWRPDMPTRQSDEHSTARRAEQAASPPQISAEAPLVAPAQQITPLPVAPWPANPELDKSQGAQPNFPFSFDAQPAPLATAASPVQANQPVLPPNQSALPPNQFASPPNQSALPPSQPALPPSQQRVPQQTGNSQSAGGNRAEFATGDTPSWLPPTPPPSSGRHQSLADPQAVPQEDAWYRPSSAQTPKTNQWAANSSAQGGHQSHGILNIIAEAARETFQNIKAIVPNQPQAAANQQQSGQPKPEGFLDRLGDAARQTFQGVKALGQAPTAEDVWNTPNQQRQRSLSRPVRDEKERQRTSAARLADSQKLRTMDVEEALAEHDDEQPAVKKLARKFDLASAGGLILIGVAIVLFALGYLTLSAINSGDDSVRLAKHYEQENKIEQAVGQLTLALQHRADDADLLIWRASLYDKLADFEHERQDLEAIVSAHPDNHDAWLKNAMLADHLAQYDKALQTTKTFLERFPNDPNAMATYVIALSGSGRYQDALDTFDKIPDEKKLIPDVVAPVQRARGYAFLKQHKLQQAVISYAQAIQLDPKNAAAHQEMAQVFEQLGNYDKAIEHLKLAVDLAPASGWNYEELAKAYDLKHDFEHAVKAYNDAVKLIPKPADDYVRMAADEMKLAHYSQALSDCEIAQKLAPTNVQAENIKKEALSKERSEKPIQTVAISDESKASPLFDPNSPGGKGYKALKAGHYQEALPLLTSAAKAEPDDPKIRTLLALAYARTGHNVEAYEQFVWLDANEALSVDSKFTFADCAMASGHPERALTLYGDCVEVRPDWTEARCRMIKACLATGLTERAGTVAQEGMARAKSEGEKRQIQNALNSGSAAK
jgi:tetratricopeptide (TPR) repeat protein